MLDVSELTDSSIMTPLSLKWHGLAHAHSHMHTPVRTRGANISIAISGFQPNNLFWLMAPWMSPTAKEGEELREVLAEEI